MSDTEHVSIADGDHHEQGEEDAGDDISEQEDEDGEDSAQPGANGGVVRPKLKPRATRWLPRSRRSSSCTKLYTKFRK